MRKVSKKQSMRNRELVRLKNQLPRVCVLCGRPANDLAHLLPRSLYPEYYTMDWNLVIMCRDCHGRYDNDRRFRSGCKELVERVMAHDECAANRYFDE